MVKSTRLKKNNPTQLTEQPTTTTIANAETIKEGSKNQNNLKPVFCFLRSLVLNSSIPGRSNKQLASDPLTDEQKDWCTVIQVVYNGDKICP